MNDLSCQYRTLRAMAPLLVFTLLVILLVQVIA